MAQTAIEKPAPAPAVTVALSAPALPYRPRDPRHYHPQMALIACGGITKHHLAAYRAAGYQVTALCDIDLAHAEKRKAEYFPEARVFSDYRDVLRRDDIEVVDLAAHPATRAAMIEDALKAGKHVLSQKPFVLDLDLGQRMVDLADRQGRRLAVNQNARWAPHFSYMVQAVRAGLLGQVTAVHAAIHWDHNWVTGTVFNSVRHLILYDFGIHWFDVVTCLLGEERPQRVYASMVRSPVQTARPALLAQAVVEYSGAQASLIFDGNTLYGPEDNTYVTGSSGTIASRGPNPRSQAVTITTAEGSASPTLEGCWFPDGFHGTMGELLLAIEEGREPSNSARNNLRSLELCFAAAASAERHEPVVPGTVRVMPE